MERERLEFDVVIVGAGPAGLAAAIRLKQLAAEMNREFEVCVVDKAAALGAHSVSGAVVDPRALRELLPDFRDRGCPIEEENLRDAVFYFTADKAWRLPWIPPFLHSEGAFVVSLSRFCAWLGSIAEQMGVNVFPGFAAVETLGDDSGRRLLGVRTGDKGVDKQGRRKGNFEPGVDLLAKVTVFAEGPRGSLLREAAKRLGLFEGRMPQAFETAVKEVIELPEDSPLLGSPEAVIHTFGYPLGLRTKGGGFLYRMAERRVSLGLVVGLDYTDPMLEPYEEFLRFKRHPFVARRIAGGRVLQQGAKTLPVGGWYSMPRLFAEGALVVGDSACTLNARRLKGVHTAMKSGMLAAETIAEALAAGTSGPSALEGYRRRLEESWLGEELRQSRNFSQALSRPPVPRIFHLGAQWLSGGRGLVDPMPIHEDSAALKPRSFRESAPVGELDGTLYLDKLTGVYLSGTRHEEDQPCHLHIPRPEWCTSRCWEEYRSPCTRFCPGQVYEMKRQPDGGLQLKLNPSNCLHCKTCEIKDPLRNVLWNCPEGGGGPNWTIL